MRPTIQQRAFEEGLAARLIGGRKENPYSKTTSPSLWDSWERGWDHRDGLTRL